MKKIISILTLVLLMLVFACGCSQEPKTQTPADTVTTEETEEVTTEEPTTEEATETNTEKPTETGRLPYTDIELVDYVPESRFTVEEFNSYFTSLNFLSDENKNLFSTALDIYYIFDVDSESYHNERYLWLKNNYDVEIEIGENYYIRSGMNFQSFSDYIYSCFVETEAIKLLERETYVNYNGELCICEIGRGTDPFFYDIRFELISENENEINFKGIARYLDFEHWDNPDEYATIKEYNYKIIMTENGWRFSQFALWN